MDSATLANQIADYDKNAKSSADVLNDAMKQYGIPEIRNRVSNLRTTLSNTENALNNVDSSVTGRTQGSLVTEAQRQRQVVNEKQPLMQNYGQISNALGNESNNMSDQMQAAQMLASGRINDYNTGRQALQSRYADAIAREIEQRRQMEADRDYQLKAKSAATEAASVRGYNLANTDNAPKSNGFIATKRDNGGFNFVDPKGSAVSAATYAQGTGIPIGQLLYKMGQEGDSYAQQLYNQLKNDPFFGKGDAAYDAKVKAAYKPIFWGT